MYNGGMDRPAYPTADQFLGLLDDPESARRWLSGLGLRDPERGFRDLRDLAARGGDPALLAALLGQLRAILPGCPDPGMALTNLERFVAACPNAPAMLSVLTLDPRTAEILVQLLSVSQHFSDLLIRDPDLLLWLRAAPPRRDRDALVADLWAELQATDDDPARRLLLRRFRHREALRIGHNDVIRGAPLEVTTLDLSHLADACVEAACRVARAHAVARHGEPLGPDGRAARFVVLALGKLGGEELNYSSDIDLIFLYDAEGQTAGPRAVTHAEFFARLGGEVVRFLSDHSALGPAYRVDMRLRPEGEQGPLARSLAATLGYYETTGRTWERQALIKCRPIAGDLDLGRQFLAAITPFVYRRYLGGAEIGEIKAMKRRIEARTHSAGADAFEVKTGRGGLRDVEFVVQFLQLLHGGTYPEVRHPNTLIAIARLEAVGCLTAEERAIMEDTYRFLRRVEHRLQTMFDLQTHQMPRDPEAQRTLAIRMGYPPASPWEDRVGPAGRFLADHRAKAELNRKILDHLLHDAFRDDLGAPVDPVVDLVLSPEPSPELIAAALGPYPFRDRATAYRNLMALAREEIEFLSQARCRHFLAAIAPRLLQAVRRTPDPDMTLTNLEKVSASLGAKAVLWELFSFNPPTLRLYVELCAGSPFLTEVLINNPGMIDDLMDSLVVDRPQSASAIKGELAELCRGAEDLAPILLGFRNKEWVRIGTRDILGREPIRDVTRELADVAEAIVGQVARDQWRRRVARCGVPRRAADGRRARWAILALGKLGGRELNYHSDLDLVFLYDADGEAHGPAGATPNEGFFAELARRTLKALAGSAAPGPLYAVDTRLRPHGASGPLVTTLEGFRGYFQGPAQPWERLALTRARVLHATGTFGREVAAAVRAILAQPIDPAALAREVVAMRRRLEGTRGPQDLKRGVGGLVDIEFVVQYLQLVHASARPDVLRPNVWEALDALRRERLIDAPSHAALRDAYDFLRTVEGRLRIAHNRGGVDLPDDPDALARLARRLGHDGPDPAASVRSFRDRAAAHAARVRALFQQVVASPAGELATAASPTP
jgi:[glutamine synthetase] adenylyltransferase / [glutamine synthetase]-adenylyl-L-tyrosine phosphorylase